MNKLRICTHWGQLLTSQSESCLSYSLCFTKPDMFWLQSEDAVKALLPFHECNSREKALWSTANTPTDYNTGNNPDLLWSLCNWINLTDIGSTGVCTHAQFTHSFHLQVAFTLVSTSSRQKSTKTFKCSGNHSTAIMCLINLIHQSFLFSNIIRAV